MSTKTLHYSRNHRAAWPILIAALFTPLVVLAQTSLYTFSNVADTSNTSPFTAFSDFPSINDAGTVAFRASFDFGAFNVFTGPSTGGGPYNDVTQNGPFISTAFEPVINNSGTVAYYAWEQFGPHAIFTAPADGNGPVVTVVDNSAGNFTDFSFPVLNNSGTVGFLATLSGGGKGVYSSSASGGALTPVADTSSTFSDLSKPSISSAGVLAFRGVLKTGPTGIFSAAASGAGSITSVVDNSGTFSDFRGPAINGAGTVLFQATKTAGGSGIYTAPVASSHPVTTIAESNGVFSNFVNSNSSLYGPNVEIAINDSGAVAFFANLANGGFGLFNGANPLTNKIIGNGEVLFGSAVVNLAFSSGSLSDSGQLAFFYQLADGREGIAVANPIPEPSTAVLVVVCMACYFCWRRALKPSRHQLTTQRHSA